MPHSPSIRIALALAAVLGFAAAAQAIDQPPGQRFTVHPDSLPAPFATQSVANPPTRVARPPNAALRLPRGFASNLFADNLAHARWIEVAANGDVFLAESNAGKITVLRDANRDGRAEVVETFVSGLRRPHGMAFRPGALYVADIDRVWRIPYTPGDLRAAAAPEPVTAEGAIGPGNGHWTRNITFSPDGTRFYVAIGSAGNVAEEPTPRASIMEFRADGGGGRIFATGLRNPVGVAFRPGTNELWTVVNERDGLGDGLVPDFLTRVVEGGFYGWPYSYVGRHPQPNFAGRRPDLVAAARVPDVLFESHSAPLGLTFYTGTMFPASYRGDAFVALHGSWNSGKPTGYKIVRVPFRDGKPGGHYETFASGFWADGTDNARVWGRPVGLAQAADGALLAADDAGNAIWRISWSGR